MLDKLIKCIKLNAWVAHLAASDKWLTPIDFAAGYDRVAPFYNQAWLPYLSPTTMTLIERLPEHIEGPIIDLGCGSGFTTEQLHLRYPNSDVAGVDISEQMLRQAQSRINPSSSQKRGCSPTPSLFQGEGWDDVNPSVSSSLGRRSLEGGSESLSTRELEEGFPPRLSASGRRGPHSDGVEGFLSRRGQGVGSVTLVQQDMLEFLHSLPNHHASLIFAGWSIGYSNPQKLFCVSQRKLKQNGHLAFIVNYMDTLEPVFHAYRVCMAEFPQYVQRAAWLHFPKDAVSLKRMLAKNGFAVTILEEGYKDITVPESNINIADWLLQTGILAGFDIMLPLQEHPALMTRFQELIAHNDQPLRHHYAMVIAKSTKK